MTSNAEALARYASRAAPSRFWSREGVGVLTKNNAARGRRLNGRATSDTRAGLARIPRGVGLVSIGRVAPIESRDAASGGSGRSDRGASLVRNNPPQCKTAL